MRGHAHSAQILATDICRNESNLNAPTTANVADEPSTTAPPSHAIKSLSDSRIFVGAHWPGLGAPESADDSASCPIIEPLSVSEPKLIGLATLCERRLLVLNFKKPQENWSERAKVWRPSARSFVHES